MPLLLDACYSVRNRAGQGRSFAGTAVPPGTANTFAVRAGGEQEVSNNDREIVSTIRARLAERMGRDRYEVWFGPGTDLQLGSGSLLVSAPNRFHQDWLRTNFRKEIEGVCTETFGEVLPIDFRIAAVADMPTASQPRTRSLRIKSSPTSTASTGAATGGAEAAPSALRSRRQFQCLSRFAVGDSNRIAHQTALHAVKQPGSLTPLFLHGPTGCGKTHLLEGIWTGLKRTHQNASVLYLSAEQFTTYFTEALRGTGLPIFRRKYRGIQVLLIDDVQFFIGKRATIGELLHTVDALLRDGRQLVFAADRPPSALKALGPELSGRISSGVVCKIDTPEYETRLQTARHFAERFEIKVSDEVLQFVASHFTEHARAVCGALKRLQATSLAIQKPISLRLAEEALADLLHSSNRLVRLGDIEKAVCEVFGLESESLQSDRKDQSVSHPRMLAMWLARKHTRAALSEIGHYFGGRKHSTVISAQKKVETWVAKGRSLELAERPWKLDDAIRRVEEVLRAG